MKKHITPCLWYNNQAKEAAALYYSAFKNSKITSQSPIVTEIELSSQTFILLDGGPIYKPNPSISFYYICEDEQELDQAWTALSKEGNIMMPLGKYPWSEKYGWIADKFGISWQLALGKISEVGQKITPSLLFTKAQYGRADEAIKLYTTIFKNSSVAGILRFDANEAPEQQGKVKHAQINLDGNVLMLMESAAAHDFEFTEGISLTVYCDTQDEIDYYWDRFTEKGEESMCGWLRDQFGVSWQITPSVLAELMKDPEKANKAMQAFMPMRKMDIEQIVKATREH